MNNLEKVGITMMLEDLKPIKTNKQLALEKLEGIAHLMENKCKDDSTYNLNKQSKAWLRHYSEMIRSEIRRYKT